MYPSNILNINTISKKRNSTQTIIPAEHVWTEEHQVDWSNVVVVSNPRDHTTRLVEEALTIRSTTNVLNRDTGFLPSGYDGLC